MNFQTSKVAVLKLTKTKEKEGFGRISDMPRTKSSPLQCIPSRNGQSKTWVLMIENSLLDIDGGDATPDIVKLRHPRTGLGAMFLFSSDNTIVQEVFSFSEKRSWFINDTVREDGKMHFSTPVDPSFLILPYLKKSKEEGKVVPLEDLLIDQLFPETCRLLKCSALENVHMLADRKGPEELNAWMYNEDKTMKWLCKKTERVAQVLKEKQINVKDNATSKNFVKSSKENSNDSDKESYIKYAHKLVSEYLTDDLSQKLSMSLGLPEESPEKKSANKRKSNQIVENENLKKVKVEEEITESPKPAKPKPKQSLAKEKANAKAASGTKAITSFFKKK